MNALRDAAGDGLRFTTRNYKHEISFVPGRRHSILGYTDEVWETLCAGIARRGFTGLVFYAGYHAFEFFLDYAGFPAAATQPARKRDRARAAFNRGLAAAHRHGLKTFMQHYITHFTPPLARALGISTTGRLANIDHPEVLRYHRFLYRETFRQCPDLDGLYFNFESAANATDLLERTFVPEWNRMKRRPIAVFRLWGANDPAAMKRLVAAYRGRSILAHKISDTSDVMYLPVADSRVTEWKKLLPRTEFIFLVGPCHNCGTNLCGQLWSDYDFMQALLADAERKGADGISFHSLNEFLSPDVATPGVFARSERRLARYNALTLEAVVDYVHGRRKDRRERVAFLSGRVGVEERAGRDLLDTVTASSQLVLLTYQQFCYTSAFDGYLNPGRWSLVQEPFYYYPATTLNDQASSPMWTPDRAGSSWLKKAVDAKVTPDNFLQPIIDYVDPAKPKATRHPKKVAALLKRHADAADAALARYRQAVGGRASADLARRVRDNAILGEFARREVLSAVELYGLYFARGRAGAIGRLRRGLAEMKAAAAALRAPAAARRSVQRALMFGRFDPQYGIRLVSRTLRAVERGGFPFGAYRDYLASRREYNEIRRIIRPMRRHNRTTVAFAVAQLREAISLAGDSLEALGPKHPKLAANVRAWLAFLEAELARTTPPRAVCGRRPGAWMPLTWSHCFRAGEHFAEDFLGFFRPLPLRPEATTSFRLWRTAGALVVALREAGVDTRARRRQWRRHAGGGSDSFVERIYVDAEGKGRSCDMFIVWPEGRAVSAGRRPNVKVKTEFRPAATSHEVVCRLPWSLVGRRPRAGDVWGLNLLANPSVLRNRCFTWAPQYDAMAGNPILFGKVRFE